MFTKNNIRPDPKLVSVNKTFSDASSRTESLRRRTESLRPVVKPVKLLDVNHIHHTIRSMRMSGGIPKKCSMK